jgi:hypothetical protein
MRRTSRTLRLVKWTGVAVSVFIAAAWALSFPVDFGWSDKGNNYQTRLAKGFAFIVHYPVNPDPLRYNPERWYVHIRTSSWQAARPVPVFSSSWGSGNWRQFSYSYLILPLWIPLIIMSTPTVFLFLLDHRRIPPGHCQRCRYDLTGNTSGMCPECGKPI